MTTYPNIQNELVQHEAFVRTIATFLLKDPNDIEDLTQDLWIRALQRGPQGSAGLRTWLKSTVRSMAGNRRRSAARRSYHESQAARVESEECPIEAWSVRQEVVRCVLALDEPFRSTVILSYGEGLSPTEIAAREGVPAGTVRSRLHRAHERLREQLAPNHEGRGRLALLIAVPTQGEWAELGISTGSVFAPLAKQVVLTAAIAACVGGGLVWWSLATGSSVSTAEHPVGRQPENLRFPTEPQMALLTGDPGPAQRNPIATEKTLAVGPAEHAFWKAVRAAQDAVPPFSIDESETDSSLRHKLNTVVVEGVELPAQMGLADVLTKLQVDNRIPIELSEKAKELAEQGPTAIEWLVPAQLSLAHTLDLVTALAHRELRWEVQGGVVHVATPGELFEYAQEHTFDFSDLALDPTEFYSEEDLPPALMTPHFDAQLLRGILWERTGFSRKGLKRKRSIWKSPAMHLEVRDGQLRIRATVRTLQSLQTYLHGLRSFLLPLPEEGIPGGPTRLHQRLSDSKLIASMVRVGGPGFFEPSSGQSLEDRLRDFGRTQRVGVLWTPQAQKQTADFSSLRMAVFMGCLWVMTEDESVPAATKSELWMDTRSMMSGRLILEATLKGRGFLKPVSGLAEPLHYTPEEVMRCLLCVQPDSWNEDPSNSMRSRSGRPLYISHDPWVLDEMIVAIEYLAQNGD